MKNTILISSWPWVLQIIAFIAINLSFIYLVQYLEGNYFTDYSFNSFDSLLRQGLLHFFSFFVPNILFYYWYGKNDLMMIHKLTLQQVGLSILILIMAYPFLLLLGILNTIIVHQLKDYTWIKIALDHSNEIRESLMQMVKIKSVGEFLLALVVVSILPAIIEEYMMRGLLYGLLRKKWGIVVSAMVTSLIFAVIHFNILAIGFIFGLSLVLHYVYERFQSMYSNILLHGLNNAFVLIIYNLLDFSSLQSGLLYALYGNGFHG